MEDILKVYQRPYDEKNPVVCMDESNKQQVQDLVEPLRTKKAKVECYDSEYRRNGVSNLFMFFEPLRGYRRVEVTDTRKALDWAHQIKYLLDVDYPKAEKVTLVMDNLNTHAGGSLYKAFNPEEASRLLDRLEIHYTPKHGSWLNIAEIELSVLSRECLDRRIPNQQILRNEVKAWSERRNRNTSVVNWQFNSAQARVKLKHLYPIYST